MLLRSSVTMRVTCGHLLLVVLEVLAVSVRGQSIADSRECLLLFLPTVQEMLEWEKNPDTACEEGSRLLSANLMIQKLGNMPKISDAFADQHSPPNRASPTLEEYHTQPDQHIAQSARALTEPHDAKHQMDAHESEMPTSSQLHSPVEDDKHQHEGVEPGKDTEETKHGYDENSPLIKQDHPTQASPEARKDNADPEMSDAIKSLLQSIGIPSFDPTLLNSLLQNFDVPPSDPRLWKSQHYVAAGGLLGSSILVSAGSISLAKRLLGKDVTQKDDSSATKEHDGGPSDHAPDSDSGSETKNTPPSSNEKDSPDLSPSRAREQDPTHHTPSPGDERNGTGHRPARTDDIHSSIINLFPATPSSAGKRPYSEHAQRLEGKPIDSSMSQIQGHDSSSPSDSHPTKSAGTNEENVDREEDSGYVLVEKVDAIRGGLDSSLPETRNENDKGTAKSSGESDTIAGGLSPPETGDQHHADKQSLPHDPDSVTDEVREKIHTIAAGSDDLGPAHQSDAPGTKAQTPSTNDASHKLAAKYGNSDVSAGLHQRRKDTEDQRPKTTPRVTFEHQRSSSSHGDEPVTDKDIEYGGTMGEHGVEQATHDTKDDQKRMEVRASDTSDESQAPLLVQQNSEKSTPDISNNPLRSLDTVLTSQTTVWPGDDLMTREIRRTERSPISRSRMREAYRSLTGSPSSPRSPTTSLDRSRWSSPSGRREMVQPQHFPDSCPVCKRNARLNADAAKKASDSRTLSSTATSSMSTVSESRRQVDSSKRSSTPILSPRSAAEQAKEKEGKRLSLRRTLSQVLASSRSKSTSSLSSGSSSKKIDRTKSKS